MVFYLENGRLAGMGAQKHQNVTILGLFLLYFSISTVLFGTFGEHLGVQRCFLGRGCATVRERGDVVVVVVEGVKMLLCIRCMREAEFGVEDGKNVCGLCAGGGKDGIITARGGGLGG